MSKLSNREKGALFAVFFVLIFGACAVVSLVIWLAAPVIDNAPVTHDVVSTEATPPPTPLPDDREPITILYLEDKGETTSVINVPETGAYFIGAAYPGTRFFAVEIQDVNGETVAVPVNSTDGYKGEKMIHLKKGSYYVQVSTNDNDTHYLVMILY